MDGQRFDDLSRSFARIRNRRQVMKLIAGAVVSGVAGLRATPAEADCPADNPNCNASPGCKREGKHCKRDEQCCAGMVCEAESCTPGCHIDNGYFPAGASPLENPCLICAPAASTTGWANNDGVACDDGNLCTQADTCQGGACTGKNPVVCAATDACHVVGVCDPATGGCSDPPAAAGTLCGAPATCVDGVAFPADACDGAGACTAGSTQPVTCAPYLCGGDACLTSCTSDSDCAPSHHCDDGACLLDEGLGRACDEESDCESGVCVAGVCCAQTCEAPASGRAICVDNGTRCDFVCEKGYRRCAGGCIPEGGCCSDDECPTATACMSYSCNQGTGECIETAMDNGTPCDDGDLCTENSACQAGVCVGQPRVCGGVINTDPCTVDLDVCDPVHGCARLLPDGTVCSPVPSNPDPTLNWACQAGACTPAKCPADECHVSYADGQGGCSPQEPQPTGAPCDDGDPCTTGDVCVNFGDRVSCEGGTNWACHADCGQRVYFENSVPPGTLVYKSRPEGNVCYDESIGYSTCTPTGGCSAGQCLPKPRPDGTACEDEANCILVGACQSGTCQPWLTAPDGSRCHRDTCSVSACFAGICQELGVVEGQSCRGGFDCCPGTYCVQDEGVYDEDWHCYTCESTLGRSCDPFLGDDQCCPDQECGCSGAATCGYGIGWDCRWRYGHEPDEE